ncbi:uncharacterized protein LOC128392394 isoform X2 [Panonychus citri]|uniref:uncharacterized protein LOC128392394 isoform X2 n=1 Tax=Panonychus citri TaxID=50023 RepID=UPI0023075AE6|nr:uncharacterized protein LOC128392394 isoform X2 [Panonychus citri]
MNMDESNSVCDNNCDLHKNEGEKKRLFKFSKIVDDFVTKSKMLSECCSTSNPDTLDGIKKQKVVTVDLKLKKSKEMIDTKELVLTLEKEAEKKLDSLNLEFELKLFQSKKKNILLQEDNFKLRKDTAAIKEQYEKKIHDQEMETQKKLKDLRKELTKPLAKIANQQSQTEEKVIPIKELEKVQSVYDMELKKLKATYEKEYEAKLLEQRSCLEKENESKLNQLRTELTKLLDISMDKKIRSENKTIVDDEVIFVRQSFSQKTPETMETENKTRTKSSKNSDPDQSINRSNRRTRSTESRTTKRARIEVPVESKVPEAPKVSPNCSSESRSKSSSPSHSNEQLSSKANSLSGYDVERYVYTGAAKLNKWVSEYEQFKSSCSHDEFLTFASIINVYNLLSSNVIPVNRSTHQDWSESKLQLNYSEKSAKKYRDSSYQIFFHNDAAPKSHLDFKNLVDENYDNEKSRCKLANCPCGNRFEKAKTKHNISRHISENFCIFVCNKCSSSYHIIASLFGHYDNCCSERCKKMTKLKRSGELKPFLKTKETPTTFLPVITPDSFKIGVDMMANRFNGNSKRKGQFSEKIQGICVFITKEIAEFEPAKLVLDIPNETVPIYYLTVNKPFIYWDMDAKRSTSYYEYSEAIRKVEKSEDQFVCGFERCVKCTNSDDRRKSKNYHTIRGHIQSYNFRLGCISCKCTFASFDTLDAHYTEKCIKSILTKAIELKRKENSEKNAK